jgi:hypothetical protein
MTVRICILIVHKIDITNEILCCNFTESKIIFFILILDLFKAIKIISLNGLLEFHFHLTQRQVFFIIDNAEITKKSGPNPLKPFGIFSANVSIIPVDIDPSPILG